MKNARYHKVNKDECEIFLDGSGREKAFDFSSINDYRSIHKFTNRNSLQRDRQLELDSESKPLIGMEKFVTNGIICMFYVFFLIFLPFSLLLCLKRVKENERLVLYRLGRIKSPAYSSGYCVVFPFIDSYQKFNIVQKEIHLPNLQIYNHENAIIDLSTRIRYRIDDVIKLTISIQDLTHTLKSVARSVLVNIVSKMNISKIELEKSYVTQEGIQRINEDVKKWGIEIIEMDITINSIVQDESSEKGDDPALRTLSTVFKSLFNGGDPSNITTVNPFPTTSSGDSRENGLFDTAGMQKFLELLKTEIPPELLAQYQNTDPTVLTTNQAHKSADSSFDSPMGILKLIEPLINERTVQEINTTYEFHINMGNDPASVEIYHLDLKTPPRGSIGKGPCIFSKVDCAIKLSDQDLKDLILDNLKPFTAYMSGRIEIDGNLQDVFRLKKLIGSVTSVIAGQTKH